MNARHGNLVSGIAALGLVAFIFYFSDDMPSTAAAFPRFIAILLLIASLILIVRSVLDKRRQATLFEDIHWPTASILVGAWLVTIFVIERFGFVIPGAVFMALVTWILSGRPRDARMLAKIGAFVIGVLATYWIIFHLVLNVASPTGGSALLW